jgi:hypothetical protein
MLPELSPEELARQKVVKLEEDLANSIIAEIREEAPADWTKDDNSKVRNLNGMGGG